MAESKRRKPTTIDDLHEDLLIHIVSYLPTLDAVRSTLISPKWLNLWHHTPTLDFDISLLRRPPPSNNTLTPKSSKFFAGFITRTLMLRPTTTAIKSVRLVFSYGHSFRTRQIDSWIIHAVSSGAGVLVFSFDPEHLDPDSVRRYRFHFSYLNSPFRSEEPMSKWDYCFVWSLELNYCSIVWPKIVPTDGFPSLIEISLIDVCLNDKALVAMVSNCPNLEILSLWNISGLRNFKIHSDSLEELELGFFMPEPECPVGSLDICAPNLCTITFNSFCVEKYCFRDLLSLVEADVRFLDELREDYECVGEIMRLLSGAESLWELNLSVHGYRLSEYTFGHSVFVNVEFLKLQTDYYEEGVTSMFKLLDLCPKLEKLVLDFNGKGDRGLAEEFRSKPRLFKIPSLKQVEMKSYRGTETELYVVELLKKHKVVLEKIMAFPVKVNGELPPLIVLF